QRLQTQLQTLTACPIVVLSIPLLFEANLTYLVKEIWVVYAHPEQQIQRLQSRNRLTPAQAQQRIQNQWPLTQKIPHADRVLNNTRDLAYLYPQIDQALSTTDL
ncbi:MAG: dephospho-CoA kinase, partial [Microcystaceae cyanobacterium]